MPLSGSPGGRVHVCVCVPIVAVCPMRAALLGVACLRVFVWPLSVSLVGFGVWYAVEVRSAGYRERCAGACRCNNPHQKTECVVKPRCAERI